MRTDDTTMTAPPMAPNHDDLMGFGRAQNGQCDIKDTHTRPRAKTASTSRYLPQGRRGSSEVAALIGVESGHDLDVVQGEAPWHLTASRNRRRSYAGLSITRCIASDERVEAYTRWRHADERGTPFTRHITFKPPTDHLTPEERIALWDRVRQRVRCWCRDCRSADTGQALECVMMTTRESKAKDSSGEHLHMLLHVPVEFQDAFDRLAPGWFTNTKVTPSNHAETFTASGKRRSGFGYLHKAAAPKDRKRDRTIWYRGSGAILGERLFSTRNLHAKARAQHEAGRRATVRLLRELRDVETMADRRERRSSPTPVPSTAIISPAGIV